MKKIAYASILSALMLCPVSAFAVDTTEPVDPGALEMDANFTIDNIRDGKPNIGGDVTVAMGAFEGFTVSGTVGFASVDGLAGTIEDGGGATITANLNALYTPLDTDHFDLDVMLDIGYEEGFYVTPSFELNYDLLPDLELWGLYLRAGLPIYGGYDEAELNKVEAEGGETADAAKADVGLELALGTYITFGEIFQILLEGGFAVNNLASKLGDTEISSPYIALGFNVEVNDNFELITEFKANLPAPDEDNYKFSGALTIGGAFVISTVADVPEVNMGSDDDAKSDSNDAA